MARVAVAGGGAAGMLAGIIAARGGHEVCLFEKNEKLGKKLFITGKGRCNLTNACAKEELMKQVMSNPRFLYSAFSVFDNMDTMRFFEELGLKMKTERGMRVFPVSDHSSDVIKVLQAELLRLGVTVRLQTPVTGILTENGHVAGVRFHEKNGRRPDGCGGTEQEAVMPVDACILATGGLSYPGTGSTGDGYRFAKECGHTVTKLVPSLVAVETKEEFVKQLQGLSLKNVELTVQKGKKVLYRELGEMMFTHFGVSGPLVLSASSYIAEELRAGREAPELFLDLKPGLTSEQLNARILRDFEEAKNKCYKNALDKLLPQRLAEAVVSLSGIDEQKKINAVSKEERAELVRLFKHLPFTVAGLRGYEEAIITKGGVSVREVSPSTMESKLVSGLYFAGEVLDVDAMTGGFNLQIAWSTAYAAGSAVSDRLLCEK